MDLLLHFVSQFGDLFIRLIELHDRYLIKNLIITYLIKNLIILEAVKIIYHFSFLSACMCFKPCHLAKILTKIRFYAYNMNEKTINYMMIKRY